MVNPLTGMETEYDLSPVAEPKHIVVIGGGLVGAETADHMAVHGAKDVTIIEMQPDIMLDGEPIPNEVVFNRFKQYGVKVVTSARVTSVEAAAVTYEKDGVSVRIDGVNTIVNATGVKPDGSVAAMLEGHPMKSLSPATHPAQRTALRIFRKAMKPAFVSETIKPNKP